MPAGRYARPRLITAEDKRYRAFVERFILERQNQRAMRPPRQRDIFGGQAEQVLRGWLAAQLPLSDRRILEYEERRSRSAVTKYRELDALVLEDNRSASVFEIKASRSAGSLRRALGQLRETREILRLLYPLVYATVLLVDTGIPDAAALAALMAAPDAPARPPQTLDEVLADLPELHLIPTLEARSRDREGVDLLRFGLDDIIALAGAENLALDWEADEQDPEQGDEPQRSTTETLYASSDDEQAEEESPLAAALRKAGMQRGD
jgi:hypothetical protein